MGVEGNTEQTVRQAALVAEQVVVFATPVDTGRARANWLAEIDGPARGTVPAQDKSGSEAIARARLTIQNWRIERNRSIHLTNNLDYIEQLDAGSSAQAPRGMTSAAILAAQAVVRRARLLPR